MRKEMKTYNEVYAPRYDVFYRDAANENDPLGRLEMKSFPMMKGDPDHKAFNDAIAFADVISNGGNEDCTIESRRYDKAKNRWDIERVWPNKTN